MLPQQYCLRWKHHHTNVQNMFAQLLEKEKFCDVTLYCSPSFSNQLTDGSLRGVSLRAHRVVVAACSELLATLLGAHEAGGEPVLVLDGAEPAHVRALLDYMYTGEMNVHHSQLASLLKTAEDLKIKGLTDIRWNNKDEPPDCQTGAVTTSTLDKRGEQKVADSKIGGDGATDGDTIRHNGGPPPLIKLSPKDKNAAVKREDRSDSESPNPKRRRTIEDSEEELNASYIPKREFEADWHHGNLDITAERVVGWGGGAEHASAEPPAAPSGARSDDDDDEEWADAPADIGSFLHTRLRVDGDNSADDESNDGAPASTSSTASTSAIDLVVDTYKNGKTSKTTFRDPRFSDVIKLNDYLKHGRRPQFWEEIYVKRVMEAVRVKELEMKQAAEILGVSYGTLYGRYRDVYGCINRPYRTARDFWQSKCGESDILERLQRGEISVDSGALALGVSVANLAAYLTEAPPVDTADFDPIPIEVDPTLKDKMRTGVDRVTPKTMRKAIANFDKALKKFPVGSEDPAMFLDSNKLSNMVCESILPIDSEPAPKAFGAPCPKPLRRSTPTDKTLQQSTKKLSGEDTDGVAPVDANKSTPPGWPSIRVASIASLRASPSPSPPPQQPSPHPPAVTSPALLMRTRPDLTIVAAKRRDSDAAR